MPAILGLAVGASIAGAQAAPGSTDFLLGRGHLWVKSGRIGLDDAAAGAWGVRREAYFALEGYRGGEDGFYLGGEIGHSGDAGATNATGDTIRDFDFWWFEMNGKKTFDLDHGWSAGAGLGWALFYADGEEVTTFGGGETADPLADVGLGAHLFVELTWRTRRLLLGLDAKYQWAFDVIDVDYSNLRLGAHLGIAF